MRIKHRKLYELLNQNPFLSHQGDAHPLDEEQPTQNQKRRGHRKTGEAKTHAGDGTRHALVLHCAVGDNRRRDGDGIVNTVLDCLQNSGFLADDSIDHVPMLICKFTRAKKWDTRFCLVPLNQEEKK